MTTDLRRDTQKGTKGHTHKYGVSSRRYVDGKMLVGVENFCLCRLDPHYVNKPSWSQGFSVVYRKKESMRFHLYPIAFVGYKFFFGDKEYSLSRTYRNRRRARERTPAIS